MPLHLHGVAAFREALDETLDLAEHVYPALQEMPQVQVSAEPELSVVAFYCRDANEYPGRRGYRDRRVGAIRQPELGASISPQQAFMKEL